MYYIYYEIYDMFYQIKIEKDRLFTKVTFGT